MTDTAERKLEAARAALVRRYPLYAMVALRLPLIEWTPEQFAAAGAPCATAATDGQRIVWCRSFIDSLSTHQVTALLAHEARHVMHLHSFRRRHRDPYRWNIACDAVVNAAVEREGFPLPPNGIPGIAGVAAEDVYLDAPADTDPSGPGDGAGFGQVIDPTDATGRPLNDADARQAERDATTLVRQALSQAKRQGALAGDAMRQWDEILAPTVPWRAVLAQFLHTATRHDYSWRRVNRRHITRGIVLPTLYSEVPGRIVVACDTSGSMTPDAMRRVASEVGQVLALTAGRSDGLDIWSCDTAVHKDVVDNLDQWHPRGGGGTSYAPIFAAAEDDIAAIVYMTDGECDEFGTEPDCPVLWCVIGARTFNPPFGTVLRIPE